MTFRTVYVDPPWPERGGGQCKRGADRHYRLLTVRDIPRVIMMGCHHWRDIAPDAHCYMWATNNYLPDALWVMRLVGFRYVTTITWHKERAGGQVGLGQYFRGMTEHLLFGVRGRGLQVCRSAQIPLLTTLVHAPVREHSVKPECFYELIEQRSTGPYLELFARNRRTGWTSWGNEAPEQKDTY